MRGILALITAIAMIVSAGALAPTANATEEPQGSTIELTLAVDCDSYTVTAAIDLFVDGGDYSLVVDGVSSEITEDAAALVVASGNLPADKTINAAIYFGNEEKPRAEDSVEVDAEPCPVSITVKKDANGAGALDFDFAGSLGSFNLSNDESKTFADLTAGSYTIDEIGAAGWHLTDIDCGKADVTDTDISDGDITIDADAGDVIVCVFTNEKDAAPTTVPTATAVPPTATPVVNTVFIPVPGPTQIVERVVTITPPSTGDAGLR